MDIKKNEEVIKQNVEKLGYELISMTKKCDKDGKKVEIIVDRVIPIQMNDIVELTEHLNKIFDDIDDENENYTLDISSLGVEKPLKTTDLPKYVNSYVNVHLKNPVNGENIIEGTLLSVIDNNVIITTKKKTRVIKYETNIDNINKIRLAIKF